MSDTLYLKLLRAKQKHINKMKKRANKRLNTFRKSFMLNIDSHLVVSSYINPEFPFHIT